VGGRARGEEKGGTEALAVGQADLQSVRYGRLRCFSDLGRFRNDREVADEFAAAAEVEAIVTRLSSGRALRSESLACASRAAARCR
jgi:hypothetical protein